MKSLKLGIVGTIVASALALGSTAVGKSDQTQPQTTPAAPKATKKATTSSPAHKTVKPGHSQAHSASATGSSRKGKKSKKVSRRGQQKIDSERTHQIQEALVREHYMSAEPTGKWDSATEDALRRYQAEHGWQNKTVPDSRALIKLGLGPSHDHLLNPESAMTTAPDSPRTTGAPTTTPNSTGPSSQPQH